MASITDSTPKDAISSILKGDYQPQTPSISIQPPPNTALQPQAPSIPPKKKVSKKISSVVQRENSLKSISEQVAVDGTEPESPTDSLGPLPTVSRLSDADVQTITPRISEVISPQSEGPTRTSETLKPMPRAKGPKKKNSISDATSPDSKAPAPRASSNTS